VPDVFEWTHMDAAISYTLVVEEVDHTPVFEGAFSGTSAPMPDPARKILRTGRPLAWRVIARDAKGVELASSETERVTVSGRH
jgi:hypothetical protein